MYQAYVLTEKQRDYLLRIFTPKFPDIIAHHATHIFGVTSNDYIDKTPRSIEVYGRVVDVHKRLECLLVSIDGSNSRSDGKAYHITWSIDRSIGTKPVMSNDVIASVYDEHGTGVLIPQEGVIRLKTKIGLTLCK